MLAHATGIPHHAEEWTIIQQLIAVWGAVVASFAAAAFRKWRTKNMPCDTISTVTVQFGKNTQREAMLAALQALNLAPKMVGEHVVEFGFGVERFDFQTGELTLRRGAEKRTAELKREYSKHVVLNQAKRYGWQVRETAPYQYEILKR